MSACFGKPHQLMVITRYSTGVGIEHVVRWCQRCGGVVQDVDIDGRTDPGALMPMAFPEVTRERNKNDALFAAIKTG